METLISQFSHVSYYFLPVSFNILFSTLFPCMLNQCSCLRVTDRMLHPYKATLYYSFIDFTFGDKCLNLVVKIIPQY